MWHNIRPSCTCCPLPNQWGLTCMNRWQKMLLVSANLKNRAGSIANLSPSIAIRSKRHQSLILRDEKQIFKTTNQKKELRDVARLLEIFRQPQIENKQSNVKYHHNRRMDQRIITTKLPQSAACKRTCGFHTMAAWIKNTCTLHCTIFTRFSFDKLGTV